jgi:hypothetical protein
MTLPNERTRSVLNTQQFLLRLATPYGGGLKRIPEEARSEARRLLRHYPSWVDFIIPGQFDPDAAREFTKREETPE